MSRVHSRMENGFLAFGRLFAEIRRSRGITQEAVAENLVTQGAVSNLEQYGELPGALVLNVLIRRLGASTQFFMTMLTQQEYEYLCWKEGILKKIGDGSIRAEDLDCRMGRSRQIHEALQGQFAEFWEGYLSGDFMLMDRAVARTVTGYPCPLTPARCLSSEEVMYILLSLEKRLTAQPRQWLSVRKILLSVLRYLEDNYLEEEQLRVYGKAVCLYGTYACEEDGEEKVRYYKKAFELQRRHAALHGMCALLQGLLREGDVLDAAERKEYEDELNALTWVKQEFQVEEPSLIYGELNQEFCLLHEVLGMYRRERGLRVRDIEENACSGKTYRALEAGKRGAKRGTYLSLAEYMGIPFGVYNAEIISDRYEDYVLVGKIKRLLNEQRDESAMCRLEDLERALGDKAEINKNMQFIASVRDVMLFQKRKITLEEYEKRVLDAIHLTIPEWDINYETHFYTQREMILVYYMAGVYRKKKAAAVAIRLLQSLWHQLEQSKVEIVHRMNEALLIDVLWKDILTDVKEYEKALEKVKIGVELSFAAGRGEYLDELVTEPGWIMNTRQKTLSDVEREECDAYFWNAYSMSRLFRRKTSQKIIQDYCNANGFDISF